MRENTDAYKTIVFDFFKEAMDVETASARLIVCGDRRNPVGVWLPKKFIKVSENTERPTMLTVKMPFWLFNRTPLRNFTSWSFE